MCLTGNLDLRLHSFTLRLRDSKCVGTIRTVFPKSIPFLHSAHMVFSHAFHARKLHTKQVISTPKGEQRAADVATVPSPQVSFLRVGTWDHCLPFFLEQVVPSGLFSALAWKENAHHLVFLKAIHIGENKELCLSQNVSAFESMANLIYFFSQ